MPSAVGWVAEHECGSAVSMPPTPRPSEVDADVRRQHLNAEPLWPSLITHDPQPLGLDTTLAPLQAGADVASLSATPRREMASASKAAPRHTRHDSLCAEWSCQQSLASADAAALGSSSTPWADAKGVSVAACVPPAATIDSRYRLWTRLPMHCDFSAAQDSARRSRGAQLCRQAGTTRAGRRTSVHCCKCRVSRPVRAKGALPRGNLCASVGT